MRGFISKLRATTEDAEPLWQTIVVGLIFALAFVGCVEAPWIAQAMPDGPRSHAPHEAPSGLRHPVSIAIAGERT